MIPKWFALTAVCAVAFFAPSCAHDRQLVGITIRPTGATFVTPAPGPQVVFTALGSYVHPPETKDITNQVTWKSDVPNLITLNNGVVSPTGVCGITNISASSGTGTAPSGNLVIGYATVTVKDSTDPLCPGGTASQSILTVTPRGSGSVTSSPAGINCLSHLRCTISDRKHDHTHRNAKCRIDFHRMDKLHIDIGEYMRSCIERRYKCNSDI